MFSWMCVCVCPALWEFRVHEMHGIAHIVRICLSIVHVQNLIEFKSSLFQTLSKCEPESEREREMEKAEAGCK